MIIISTALWFEGGLKYYERNEIKCRRGCVWKLECNTHRKGVGRSSSWDNLLRKDIDLYCKEGQDSIVESLVYVLFRTKKNRPYYIIQIITFNMALMLLYRLLISNFRKDCFSLDLWTSRLKYPFYPSNSV